MKKLEINIKAGEYYFKKNNPSKIWKVYSISPLTLSVTIDRNDGRTTRRITVALPTFVGQWKQQEPKKSTKALKPVLMGNAEVIKEPSKKKPVKKPLKNPTKKTEPKKARKAKKIAKKRSL